MQIRGSSDLRRPHEHHRDEQQIWWDGQKRAVSERNRRKRPLPSRCSENVFTYPAKVLASLGHQPTTSSLKPTTSPALKMTLANMITREERQGLAGYFVCVMIREHAPKARDFTNRRYRLQRCCRPRSERAKSRSKSKVRARFEHAIGVVKRVFGSAKVRYRGLKKNTHRLLVTCVLANLFMVRRQTIGLPKGVMCLQPGRQPCSRPNTASTPPNRAVSYSP